MGNRKKPFIDPKRSVTFQLVHRSQQDPLIANEEASQYVLVPVKGKGNVSVPPSVSAEGEREDVCDQKRETHSKDKGGDDERDKRLQAQAEHGIYFDDEYDYMQHLKEMGQDPNATYMPAKPQKKTQTPTPAPPILTDLPSEVFPSAEVNPIGMLNLCPPVTGLRLDLDMDVMRALDDDVVDDFDDVDGDLTLEDDFVVMAMGEEGKAIAHDDNVENYQGEEEEEEDSDDARSMADSECTWSGEETNRDETKSCFTEYSMTSSVLTRSHHMQTLDDRFETVYEEYEESQWGEPTRGEAKGTVDLANIQDVLDEYMTSTQLVKGLAVTDPTLKDCPAVQKVITEAVEPIMDEEEMTQWRREREEREAEIERGWAARTHEEEEKKWDVQSVVSTYSNIYNHPKLIKEERRRSKTANQTKAAAMTATSINENETLNSPTNESSHLNIESDSDDDCSGVAEKMAAISLERRRGETKEEKTLRKKAIREQRKAQREVKKMTKKAFKTEEMRQKKVGQSVAPIPL